MTKRPQPYAEADLNIVVCSYLFKKEKRYSRRDCICNMKRGSGTYKYVKKTMQSLYKIEARKRHATSMERDARETKMEPKWEPTSRKYQ